MSGWIKLHRSLLDWQWVESPNHFTLFGHLLLRANHKATEWRGETISRGQLLTGRKQLAAWTGLSEMQIRRVVKDFLKSKEIEVRATKSFSIITVLNYETYQDNNQQATNEQPTKNQQRTTSKNVIMKEGKNVRRNTLLTTSLLSVLFKPEDEIQSWLLTGTDVSHKELLEKYSHHVLAEEIKKAYIWTIDKNMNRKASGFLLTWLSNSNTQAFSPGSAKAAFKYKSNSVATTPENPTGSPYLQEAIDKGMTA